MSVANEGPGAKALLLDFGGVISITMFERHPSSEAKLGLPRGSLNWRGPFDPTGDALWAAMLADEISERDIGRAAPRKWADWSARPGTWRR